MRLVRRIELPSPEEREGNSTEDASARMLYWWWYERAESADGEGSVSGSQAVELSVHNADVERYAHAFAQKLGLDTALAEAVGLSGHFHDLGKRRIGWQRGIGNFDANLWLAKSGERKGRRDVTVVYRHEFGSLVEPRGNGRIQVALQRHARRGAAPRRRASRARGHILHPRRLKIDKTFVLKLLL